MAIEIVEKSREFNKVEIYLMTVANNIPSIKTLNDGEVIPVAGHIIFVDHKENEDVEILSIITPEKKVYSCQSVTFKKSFLDIVDVMGGEKFSVIKTSGRNKSGREYINCELDISSVSMPD